MRASYLSRLRIYVSSRRRSLIRCTVHFCCFFSFSFIDSCLRAYFVRAFVRIGYFSFPFSCQKVAWRKSFASNEISSVYPRAILKMGSINRYSRVHRTDPAFDSSRSKRKFRFEFSLNPRVMTYISSSKKTISMIGMCVRSVICTKSHGHICNRIIVRSSGRLRHLDFFSHYLAGINPRTIDHTHDFKTTSDLSFWLRPTGISQSVRPRGIPRFSSSVTCKNFLISVLRRLQWEGIVEKKF